MFSKVKLSENGQIITLSSSGGDMRFHAMWMRDNAPDADTRSAVNGQRLITLNDIPADVAITDAGLDGDQVLVTFSDRPHAVAYDAAWLAQHCYDMPSSHPPIWINPELTTWQGGARVPAADYKDVMTDDAAKLDWLEGLHRFGVAKLDGGPIESGALMDVAAIFGYVRETNYGKWFEVRTEVNPVNLAYTGLGLQAHTDNPYRDPVPTMQILYCLENAAEGGDSMVVDGFACVERLMATAPEAAEILSRYCARFDYRGSSGVALSSKRPMVETAPDGELTGIRFNNRSAAAFTDVPFDDMPAYYDAYRKLSELIDDPAMQVSFKLNPGECFIVDNTRVLHARNGYTGEGTRWLQGCYPDKDGLLSTIASMKSMKEAAE
ncbi:MAG: TauD/TfdA family dioxygenase [Alphaproteobacteria bacterium]|nr:TauD/TfdA family dioxygenase [Alphaproteobacteria bacterium]